MPQVKLIKIGLWVVYIIAAGLYSTAKGEALSPVARGVVNHLDASGWVSAASQAATSKLAQFERDTADSVCLVRTADGSAGSGSLVEVEGRLFVLTNFHVVRNDASGRPFQSASVTFTRLGVVQTLQLVATDEDSDVVALDGEPLRGSVPPLWVAAASAYDSGQSGAANVYGHPHAGEMRGRNTQYWRGNDAYAVDEAGQPVAAVQYAGGAISGESGGPLVTDQQVVAICWGHGPEGAGRAVPLPRIHNLLRRIFQTQCYGPTCPIPNGPPRGGGQVIINSPAPRQPQQPPQVWVNPNFGPPQQQPPVQQPPGTPQWGPQEPTQPTDYRGPLVVAGGGLASFLANFRKRL